MATPGTQYPISEYARLFPDMAQEDYARLVTSIGENGLLEPNSPADGHFRGERG